MHFLISTSVYLRDIRWYLAFENMSNLLIGLSVNSCAPLPSLPHTLLNLIKTKHTEVLLLDKGKAEIMFDSCHMSVSDLTYCGKRQPDDTNDCSSFNSYRCDERCSQQT